MAVKQIYSPKSVEIGCDQETTMSEMALACQMAFGWFLGHGAYRFKVVRERIGDSVYLHWSTDLPFRSLEFTLGASLKQLREENYLPQRFVHTEIWTPPAGGTEFKIVLGQQRISTREALTLIEGRQVPASQPLFIEAYGVSDLLATVFVAGAKEMQYQISLDMVQVKLDRSFTEKVVRDWFDRRNSEPTYYPNHKITKIS